MQVIFENEDEGGDSRRTGTIDPLICIGRISGCIEGEYYRGVRNQRDRVQDSGRIFDKFKEGIWWRRRGVSKSGRA